MLLQFIVFKVPAALTICQLRSCMIVLGLNIRHFRKISPRRKNLIRAITLKTVLPEIFTLAVINTRRVFKCYYRHCLILNIKCFIKNILLTIINFVSGDILGKPNGILQASMYERKIQV